MNATITKKTAVILCAACILFSGAVSYGGTILASGDKEIPAVTQTQSESAVSQSIIKTSTSDGSFQSYTIADIAESAADSVVEIITESETTSGYRRQMVTVEGAGSGVIISEDGKIITNNHVVEGANKITVRLKNGESHEAVLLGTDSQTDIAVIKIDATGLSAAVFGKSSELRVGDTVIAVGNPLGELGGTVTAGIISALDREITIDGETMNLLQTDAAVNAGNSGGALFNEFGELIGVVVAKSSGAGVEGLGFAIPIDDVVPVADELISVGYIQGRVDLGMTLINLNTQQLAMMYRVSQTGVYVLEAESGGSAEKAGFMSGDCIISVDGVQIASSAEVNEMIEAHEIGETLTFVILRGGEIVSVSFTLIENKPN